MKLPDKFKKIIGGRNMPEDYCTCCQNYFDPELEEYEYLAFDFIKAARLIIAIILLGIALVFDFSDNTELIISLVSAAVAGYDLLMKMAASIIKKRFPDNCIVLFLAVVAAFIIGKNLEAAFVTIIFQAGMLFQEYAAERLKCSVEELMYFRNDFANVLVGDGQERRTPVEDVVRGDIIIIYPGETIPLDCVVTEGQSLIDMSGITGEQAPRTVKADDILTSGSVNIGSAITAEVNSSLSGSTSRRILKTMRNGYLKASNSGSFISTLASVFTPLIFLLSALLTAILVFAFDYSLSESLYRALVFLIVACPCAFLIPIPLVYFAALGGSAKNGIVFKSADTLSSAAKIRSVVFDKNGTLTTGGLRVLSVKPLKMDADLFLKIAAHAEAYSSHPIGKAIVSAYGDTIYIELIDSFAEHPGKGITVVVDGIQIALGSQEFLEEQGADIAEDGGLDMAVYMAFDGIYAGRIILTDTVKEDAYKAVTELKEEYGCHVTLVSGDSLSVSEKLAKATGIEEYYSECLPLEKDSHIQEITDRIKKGTIAFVGAWKNEDYWPEAADLRISLGEPVSPDVFDIADITILNQSPLKIASAISAARSAQRIIRQNLTFIAFIKVLILVLGAIGLSPLWFAALLDACASLAAILNSLRAFNVRVRNIKKPLILLFKNRGFSR